MSDETASEWCARMWSTVHPEFGRVHRWCVQGYSPLEESTWELLEDIYRPSTYEELETAIDRACANNPGKRRYRVKAWLEGQPRSHYSRKGWPSPGAEEDDPSLVNGSQQSMLAQTQQYSLALQRLLIQTDDRRSRQLSAFNEALFARVQSLESERRQYLDAIESREDQQVERLLKIQKSEQWSNALGALISVGRAKLLGGPQPGEQGDALKQALRSFWETLTEEQIDGLMSSGSLSFRPEQLAALVTLMKDQAPKTEEPKSLPEAPSPTSGPVPRETLLAARENLTTEEYAQLISLLSKGIEVSTSSE